MLRTVLVHFINNVYSDITAIHEVSVQGVCKTVPIQGAEMTLDIEQSIYFKNTCSQYSEHRFLICLHFRSQSCQLAYKTHLRLWFMLHKYRGMDNNSIIGNDSQLQISTIGLNSSTKCRSCSRKFQAGLQHTTNNTTSGHKHPRCLAA